VLVQVDYAKHFHRKFTESVESLAAPLSAPLLKLAISVFKTNLIPKAIHFNSYIKVYLADLKLAKIPFLSSGDL
jgi:hypothetical protein